MLKFGAREGNIPLIYLLPCWFLGLVFLTLLYLALIPEFMESERPLIVPKLVLLFWTCVILGLPLKWLVDIRKNQGKDIPIILRIVYLLLLIGSYISIAIVVVLPVIVIILFASLILTPLFGYMFRPTVSEILTAILRVLERKS